MESGYSSATGLLFRSLFTLGITVGLAKAFRQAVVPSKFSTQVVRLANSGIALMLAFEAYKGLAASTVTMVGRLDIPFAVLLAFGIGKRSFDFKVWLSLVALGIIATTFLLAGDIDESPLGLGLAVISVLMTSIAYLLVKRSTKDENNFVICNTTNIGCIVVGLVSGSIRSNLILPQMQHLWLFALAGISQFMLNYTMCILYRRREVEHAQRPYLAGTIGVLVTEQIIEHKFFSPLLSGIIISMVLVGFLITLPRLPGAKGMQWIQGKLMRRQAQPVLERPEVLGQVN